jgi:O-methyltransferase
VNRNSTPTPPRRYLTTSDLQPDRSGQVSRGVAITGGGSGQSLEPGYRRRATDCADAYLSLIKKALSFVLWPEPPMPVDVHSYRSRLVKYAVLRGLSTVLARRGFQLVKHRPILEADRIEGLMWPSYAVTMIGLRRLDNLQRCVETVLGEQIPGDLIETGVWRGGACILMRAVLASQGVTDRRVFVADSFKGLPRPDPQSYPADRGDLHHAVRYLAVSRAEVEDNFRRFDLLDHQVVFLEGWFKDTLRSAAIDRLALMRLDGDMYESTVQALEALYPKLSAGGFCIVDDYALAGCRRAVDHFRSANGISTPLEVIDSTGRWWRK